MIELLYDYPLIEYRSLSYNTFLQSFEGFNLNIIQKPLFAL